MEESVIKLIISGSAKVQTISDLLHSYFADQDVVERCEISRCRNPNGRIKRMFTDVRLSDCLLLSMPHNLAGKKSKIKVRFGPVETCMGNVYELVSVVYHIGRSTELRIMILKFLQIIVA